MPHSRLVCCPPRKLPRKNGKGRGGYIGGWWSRCICWMGVSLRIASWRCKYFYTTQLCNISCTHPHSYSYIFLLTHTTHRACLWWKAIAGNDKSSPVHDYSLSYDLLPPVTRWIVSSRLCRLYPRLHHANVEIRWVCFIHICIVALTGNETVVVFIRIHLLNFLVNEWWFTQNNDIM